MANEHECSNCGEGCSEQDLALGGICAWCDEAAAADLREQAAEYERAELELEAA